MGFLTYGEDFTDEVQVMASFKNGRMDVGSNFFDLGYTSNLMATLVARGVPSFDPTNCTLLRYKTSELATANKAYDNVLLITGIQKRPESNRRVYVALQQLGISEWLFINLLKTSCWQQ
ncbi:hypothetical protein N5V81_13415 [Escherichia coli]|nr:hypothetical protein [Escherichia coli]